MSLEEQLSGWTGPSSDSEKGKQERTERMVREAIDAHSRFDDCELSVYAKGSYPNNTNVRMDSDVDIAVECTEAEYWGEAKPGAHVPQSRYKGKWTPTELRKELNAALVKKFTSDVDASGSTAIRVHSSSARVEADVVPCFSYRYYLSRKKSRVGTKVFKTDGSSVINYPAQQLTNGTEKNKRTGHAYKRAVRILKRVQNAMVQSGHSDELPSYFIECLAYNCPDQLFSGSNWTEIVRATLIHFWNELDGDEPEDPNSRWKEVNGNFFLFHSKQKWTRADGRSFSLAAWNHLGFS